MRECTKTHHSFLIFGKCSNCGMEKPLTSPEMKEHGREIVNAVEKCPKTQGHHSWTGHNACKDCGMTLYDWATEAILNEVKRRAADKNRVRELSNEIIGWNQKCALLERELAEDVEQILELGQQIEELERENKQSHHDIQELTDQRNRLYEQINRAKS